MTEPSVGPAARCTSGRQACDHGARDPPSHEPHSDPAEAERVHALGDVHALRAACHAPSFDGGNELGLTTTTSSSRVIARCGHSSNLDRPEQFDDALREFWLTQILGFCRRVVRRAYPPYAAFRSRYTTENRGAPVRVRVSPLGRSPAQQRFFCRRTASCRRPRGGGHRPECLMECLNVAGAR